MSRNVQIRDLDDATYAVLRARAAAQDLSLSQYLRRELDRLAAARTMSDLLAEADEWRARHGGVTREAVAAAVEDVRTSRP